ncbi:hypothetical protein E2C01_039004 [Portunus trituberculatus]|uniref:Uncharacterized protein n=1 Tax=Portunus trituberculatus TaxID=210409 RepID=A0A5B7FK12_PORTR|nr:hypothetical protein [Portunus trituberculatus]
MTQQNIVKFVIWACVLLTPIFSHATPFTYTHAQSHTHARTLPSLPEDGKDKQNSISVPRLAPGYPILNTTLGILSFAAFAVYIAMLLGGLLGGDNPAREAVDRWVTS